MFSPANSRKQASTLAVLLITLVLGGCASFVESVMEDRYIYEHLFLAKLHFSAAPKHYFQLVRSHTPPGKPIARISTTRPFDDPKAERVYYRLWRDPSSIVTKNHMPYLLDDARMQRWEQSTLTVARIYRQHALSAQQLA